ncbi:ATP nucleotide 3'-pyrophosphokinase [Streptomyces sp. NPDC046876]|uniref:ATP nucleotide 3'-pyrophosphokinase n=1 Tax=Streptomyces sp. NPDC046876 TaxID=3155616 RepID=UPI0033C3EC41
MRTTTVTRTAVAAALATALALGGAATATAATAAPAPSPDDGWTGEGGLSLNREDNQRVDAYLDRAQEAEKSISPRVRAAAWITGAELTGFDHRLKSPDSLKRKVATSLEEHPEQNVDTVLAGIGDAVRYTLQWPDEEYTEGVATAARLLSDWGNDSTKWSNTWGRAQGYKGLNTGWRAPRSGQLFEVQFHTPASKWAQEATHKLYEEQRLPGTSPERKKELQAQQNAIFASVPVPPGADRLTAPGPVRLPAPAPLGRRR